MQLFAAVTDQQWFDFLRDVPDLDEVNFWQPSATTSFRALRPGDMFLFKLHRSRRTGNRDLIAGGGIFAYHSVLPISLAWEAFGTKNGAADNQEMRRRLSHYRSAADDGLEDFKIGCIILTQPFFLEESHWIAAPDWADPIVRGRGYRLESPAGAYLWENLTRAWQHKRSTDLLAETERIAEEKERYGRETRIRPRLGQGAFRVLVTDAYRRACVITEERSLPALEAAHIKPYRDGGPHLVSNGLLLRSDLHRLFDRGYVTVTPEYRIEISRRLKDEFENGRSYYPYQGRRICYLPDDPDNRPRIEFLAWHNENRFLG